MIPKDIDKWDNNQWMRQMVYCKPSSGGAVGVVFAWAGRAYSKQSLSKASEAAFVIKPIQGSPAPTKFAEHILSKFGGAQSPNSKPIARRSPSGTGLVFTLKIFRDRESDPQIKARWKEIFQHYDRAETFLIQETQVGIKEFGDEYREKSGLATMLLNTELMTNLGKLFVADALIGNGDRLSNMNTGNIIFKPDGTLCSIDTTTILTNFQAILNDQTLTSNTFNDTGTISAKHWATNDILKVGGLQVPSAQQQADYNKGKAPAVAPSFALDTMFDVDNWWDKMFRGHLEAGLKKLNPPLNSPSETAWKHGKMCFKKGVEEGIKQIDTKLSGLNWLLIKNKYKSYVNKYGGDPNLDWTNFKIRRRYIKLRKKGIAEDIALKAVQDYVAKKMPGL